MLRLTQKRYVDFQGWMMATNAVIMTGVWVTFIWIIANSSFQDKTFKNINSYSFSRDIYSFDIICININIA